MNLQTALRGRRVELGLPRKKLERRLRVTRGYVSKLETGDRLPSFRMLAKWLRALDVELELRPR